MIADLLQLHVNYNHLHEWGPGLGVSVSLAESGERVDTLSSRLTFSGTVI